MARSDGHGEGARSAAGSQRSRSPRRARFRPAFVEPSGNFAAAASRILSRDATEMDEAVDLINGAAQPGNDGGIRLGHARSKTLHPLVRKRVGPKRIASAPLPRGGGRGERGAAPLPGPWPAVLEEPDAPPAGARRRAGLRQPWRRGRRGGVAAEAVAQSPRGAVVCVLAGTRARGPPPARGETAYRGSIGRGERYGRPPAYARQGAG